MVAIAVVVRVLVESLFFVADEVNRRLSPTLPSLASFLVSGSLAAHYPTTAFAYYGPYLPEHRRGP